MRRGTRSRLGVGLLVAAVHLLLVAAATAGSECAGDCDGDGVVGVNELVAGVNIALGHAAVSACPAFDRNRDGQVAVNELVAGVSGLLHGCGVAPPTAPPTATFTPTATPPLATFTPTATPTRTRAPTRTQTRTRTPARSVCGGSVESAPAVCNLTVIPNPVSRAGTIAYRFGISDLEGDVTRVCIQLTHPPLEPETTCAVVRPPNIIINGIQTTNPGPASVLQFGIYHAALQAHDAAGHGSDIITATFQVQ